MKNLFVTSKVLIVKSVALDIEKTNPPQLIIQAEGEVNTSGWSNGQLIPYVYVMPPEDGIYEFDFIASPPSPKETVLPVTSSIKAVPFVWQDFPQELKGVRVYASQNSIESTLPTLKKDFGVDKSTVMALQKVSSKTLQEKLANNDHFSILNAFVWEDILEVKVRYSGGCAKHQFELLWDGTILKSNPEQIPLVLVHNSNGDACRAIVTETIQFDLSNELNHGVLLQLKGWNNLITY